MHQIGKDITYANNDVDALVYKKIRLYLLMRNATFTILHTSWGIKRLFYLVFFIFREYAKQLLLINENKIFRYFLSGIYDGVRKEFSNPRDFSISMLLKVVESE